MYLCGQGYTPQKVAKTKRQVTCKNCLHHLHNPQPKNLTPIELARYKRFKREHKTSTIKIIRRQTGIAPNITVSAIDKKGKLVDSKDISDYESW